MARVMGNVSVPINQSQENPPTCFGLPGARGIPASWSNCTFVVHACVLDNERAYVGIDGMVHDSVISNQYQVIMVANKDDWNWQVVGGTLQVPAGSATLGQATVDVGNDFGNPNVTGAFIWNFQCAPFGDGTDLGDEYEQHMTNAGFAYVGQLPELGGSSDTDTNGYIWLSGTGTYQVDDPIYPDPVMITIPGFLAFSDYFPWAIRKGGSWASCNRSGGSLTIRKSGAWRDVKNVSVGSGDNKAFYRSGGTWAVAPQIGAE